MRAFKELTGEAVVVSTRSADLRGVVSYATREVLALVDAAHIIEGRPVPVSGVVLVPVARVEFVQVVSA